MADNRMLSFTAEQIDAILAAAQKCSNRNLLDNWDFRNPVNQRGATSWAGGYGLDRWVFQHVTAGSVTVHDGYITVSATNNDGLFTRIETDALEVGKTYTFALLLNDNTILSTQIVCPPKNGIAAFGDYNSAWSAALLYTGNAWSAYLAISYAGAAHTIDSKAVKIEAGSVSTLANDPPADYGEELRKCQRYYFQRHFLKHETIGLGYLGSAWLSLALGIGTPMRTNTPTLAVTGALALLGASPATALIPAQASCSGCSANLGFSTTAATQGACYVFPPDDGGATISLSADL